LGSVASLIRVFARWRYSRVADIFFTTLLLAGLLAFIYIDQVEHLFDLLGW
jgi:hypothetical protein